MDSRRELELLCRVWRAEASLRDEILRKRDLPGLTDRVAQLESSYAYRIGTELVRAVRSPVAALGLPVRLAGLASTWVLGRLRARRAQRSAAPRVSPEIATELPRSARPEAVRVLPQADESPRRAEDLRIAAVCDRFTADNIALECQVCFLAPDSWAEQITRFRPHLVFVESAWLGLNGEWRGLVSDPGSSLRALVEACRPAGIPTVFWNKEDPLHFEAFISTARLFDFVCTTDLESIPLYKRELGHDRVFLLPFALQPRLHHPIGASDGRRPASFFAGAWYGHLQERCEDFVELADALALAGDFDILDRNAASNDPERAYPDRYRAFVRGGVPYSEMADVCRRYVAALSINTVKQSSSMYARRALELIGSGTTVYSNHCHALRLAFGDLVHSTDDGERVLRLAYREFNDPDALSERWRRLCALRKALTEHTWGTRLADIARWALEVELPERSRKVDIITVVANPAELDRICMMASRQQGVECTVHVHLRTAMAVPENVQVLSGESLGRTVQELFGAALVAPWHPDDSYGPYYLLDLSLGQAFGFGKVVGKAGYRRVEAGRMVESGGEYRLVHSLHLRRSLFPGVECSLGVGDVLARLDSGTIDGERLLSVDALSYVEGGKDAPLPEGLLVGLDHGVSLRALSSMAVDLPALEGLPTATAGLTGAAIASLFADSSIPGGVSVSGRRTRLELVSKLSRGESVTIESQALPGAVASADSVYLDAPASPALEVYLQQCVSDGRVLGSIRLPPYTTVSVPPVEGERSRRIAFRVTGACVTYMDALRVSGGRPIAPSLVGSSRLLLVANGYPSRESRYRNAFLHRRIKAYKARGVAVDVVWVREDVATTTYEFDGVEVTVCCADALRASLARTRYEAIAAHFVDRSIWRAIEEAARLTRIVLWLHGAEIQSWTRRRCNYGSEAEIDAARTAWEDRREFWREVFSATGNNLQFVFVSSTFMDEVHEDIGMVPPNRQVIHNPIETSLFHYEDKPSDLRWKILSIRPHASRIYANDIVAEVIHRLAREPEFEMMRFHLVGDGELFDQNFGELQRYANVFIERRFLSQEEIVELHRESGILLIPTRGDTHGVSRDEAMSSGLVPVTCAAGSVPEFVDDTCGVIVPIDDVAALTEGVLRLVRDPLLFQTLSVGAACRVRRQSAADLVIAQELGVLGIRDLTERRTG